MSATDDFDDNTISFSYILQFCTLFKFPSNVKNTSLQLLHIINKNRTLFKNSHLLALFLGAKIEEIQENMIDKFIKFNKNKIDENIKESLIKDEMILVKLINFNFTFNDVYLCTYSLCVELNEKGIIKYKDTQFNEIEKILDLMLCTDYKDIKTIVASAINKYYRVTVEEISQEEINKQKEKMKRVKIISREAILNKL